MTKDILETMVLAAFDAEPKPSMRANLAAYRNSVRAALTAAEKAGYVMVPVEPTKKMADAGKGAAGFLTAPEGWSAMIEARPKV